MSIFASDGVAQALHSALDGLSARQRVIADNISNVNTPGFRASAVEFETSLRAAIADGTVACATPAITTTSTGDPVGANGNDVDLAKETMAATQSVFQYQLLSRAATDRYDLLRTAAGTF